MAQDEYGCTDEIGRDQCLLQYVEEEKAQAHPAVCEEITDSGYRDLCYFKLAAYQSSIALCDNMIGNDQNVYYNKDECYLNLALDKNMPACEYIAESELQQICQKSIALTQEVH